MGGGLWKLGAHTLHVCAGMHGYASLPFGSLRPVSFRFVCSGSVSFRPVSSEHVAMGAHTPAAHAVSFLFRFLPVPSGTRLRVVHICIPDCTDAALLPPWSTRSEGRNGPSATFRFVSFRFALSEKSAGSGALTVWCWRQTGGVMHTRSSPPSGCSLWELLELPV